MLGFGPETDNSLDGPFPLWPGEHNCCCFQKLFEMLTCLQVCHHLSRHSLEKSGQYCMHIWTVLMYDLLEPLVASVNAVITGVNGQRFSAVFPSPHHIN